MGKGGAEMKVKRYAITFRWLRPHCNWGWSNTCHKLELTKPCTEANCPLLKRRKVIA